VGVTISNLINHFKNEDAKFGIAKQKTRTVVLNLVCQSLSEQLMHFLITSGSDHGVIVLGLKLIL
jgi:hypothetical protein